MARKKEFQDKIYIPKCQRRDHEIYEMCRVRGRTQREAAAKFGISQARVSKIIREVTIFHSLIDPTERGLSREQRARAALRLHEQRLDYAIGEANREWETSNENEVALQQTYRVAPGAAADKPGDQATDKPADKPAMPTKTLEKETRKVVTKKRDPRYLDRFVKYSQIRVKFEGFDEYGNIDVSDNGRLRDIPDKQDMIADRELKKAAFLGHFDTEGDVGPPKWFMDRVGARYNVDGSPYVSDQELTTKSASTNEPVPPTSDSDNATRNGALSRKSGLSSEGVVAEEVTEKNAVQKRLSKGLSEVGAEVVDELLGDGEEKGRKSVVSVVDVVESPVAVQPLTPALSPEYRGEGVKTEEAPPKQPAPPAEETPLPAEDPPPPKYRCGVLKVVEEVLPRPHSENFPELSYLARNAIQTLADHGIRVMPRPANYVDPKPPPERLMPDGLPWARSEEEARARGYMQWTTDRTPEEEAEWQFRHLPQACQKAYNLLEVLEIDVVPVSPGYYRLG